MEPDAAFARAAAELFNPAMGTEHVAPLLHSLVRMTRPRRILEVGLGYTSLFLLDALSKAAQDHRDDQVEVQNETRRARLLNTHIIARAYSPLMIGIDDFSYPQSHCAEVQAIAERLGLAPFLKLMPGDFRAMIPKIAPEDLPLDMIWLDCGGTFVQADLLSLCWPLLSQQRGLLAVHYTHHPVTAQFPGKPPAHFLFPGAILNEIKRQQAIDSSQFEVLSLVEPYKVRQGSVTLIRKLPPQDRQRDGDWERNFPESTNRFDFTRR